MGISWGGKIATATAAAFPHEIDALALLSPGLYPRIGPNRWQRFQLKFARRFEITKQDIPIPLRAPELFTDAVDGQQFIANDPLALHTVTSGLLNAGQDLDQLIGERAADVCCPVLLMLAERDRIIDNAKTRVLVTRFGSSHLTYNCYQNACHTLEFESNRVTFFRFDGMADTTRHWRVESLTTAFFGGGVWVILVALGFDRTKLTQSILNG